MCIGNRSNPLIIQSIVVLVETEADVSATLQFVQQWDLELAIACGRHSYYEASSTTGLVLGRKLLLDML